MYRVEVGLLSLGRSRPLVAEWFHLQDGELLYEYKHTGPVYEAQWHPTLPYVAVTGSSTDVRVVPFNLS